MRSRVPQKCGGWILRRKGNGAFIPNVGSISAEIGGGEFIRDPRVHYLDLTAIAAEREFSDDAHPRPEFAAKWTAPLLLFIKDLSA